MTIVDKAAHTCRNDDGVYSLSNSGTDVLLMAFFGFVGYVLLKLGCSFPPLVLAMGLGPLMEENLRRSMQLADGDPTVFITRPLSGGFIVAKLVLLVLFIAPGLRKKRQRFIQDERGES